MIPYRAMLDVPAELLRYLSRLLAAERRYRVPPEGSRKLSCRDQAILALHQAILALRWVPGPYPDRAARPRPRYLPWTACRYVAEAADVLSQQAPGLPQALERALTEGVPCVILDGKVFASDRCSEAVTNVKGKEINTCYSGRPHHHGGGV